VQLDEVDIGLVAVTVHLLPAGELLVRVVLNSHHSIPPLPLRHRMNKDESVMSDVEIRRGAGYQVPPLE
jgi:hypothetical protein